MLKLGNSFKLHFLSDDMYTDGQSVDVIWPACSGMICRWTWIHCLTSSTSLASIQWRKCGIFHLHLLMHKTGHWCWWWQVLNQIALSCWSLISGKFLNGLDSWLSTVLSEFLPPFLPSVICGSMAWFCIRAQEVSVPMDPFLVVFWALRFHHLLMLEMGWHATSVEPFFILGKWLLADELDWRLWSSLGILVFVADLTLGNGWGWTETEYPVGCLSMINDEQAVFCCSQPVQSWGFCHSAVRLMFSSDVSWGCDGSACPFPWLQFKSLDLLTSLKGTFAMHVKFSRKKSYVCPPPIYVTGNLLSMVNWKLDCSLNVSLSPKSCQFESHQYSTASDTNWRILFRKQNIQKENFKQVILAFENKRDSSNRTRTSQKSKLCKNSLWTS